MIRLKTKQEGANNMPENRMRTANIKAIISNR
jgi:hypothetical protein